MPPSTPHFPGFGSNDERDWSLGPEQMLVLFQHQPAILAAYASQNQAALDPLWNSAAYRAVFWDMSLDEAVDRYEVMLGGGVLLAYQWFLEMSEAALQDLAALETSDRLPLYQGLATLLASQHPSDLAPVKRLFQHPRAEWRMRCGNYHLLFDLEETGGGDYQGRLRLQRALHRDRTYEAL
jgi:hypothetical protein